MAKRYLMQHRIGGFWLVVEEHVGCVPDAVLVSLRETAKDARRPGSRMAFDLPVGRAQLLGLAYDLLDVVETMLPETAMTTSAVIAKAGALPCVRNKRFSDGARECQGPRSRAREDGFMAAFARIQGRMPVLQRAQRVLERCDDATADWIEDVLTAIERTGRPPLLAWHAPPSEASAAEAPRAKPGLLARLASLTRGKPPAPGVPTERVLRGAPLAGPAPFPDDPNDAGF